MAHISTAITGAAGEYFAAAELSARGWIATISVRGAPATDVLAQHAETGRLIAVQTETAGPGMTDFNFGARQRQTSARTGIASRSMTRSPPRPTTSGSCSSG